MVSATETGNFSAGANKTKVSGGNSNMADYAKEAASACLDAVRQPSPPMADIQGLAGEMTNVIRSNPIPALLAGIALGFLLASVILRR